MKGFDFPKMFSGNSVSIISGRDCIVKQLSLLLHSELYEFRYDPGYGSNVPLLRFRPDNRFTRDLLIDAIYDAQIFCPNIHFSRGQIVITKEGPATWRVHVPILMDTNDVVTDVILYLEAIS